MNDAKINALAEEWSERSIEVGDGITTQRRIRAALRELAYDHDTEILALRRLVEEAKGERDRLKSLLEFSAGLLKAKGTEIDRLKGELAEARRLLMTAPLNVHADSLLAWMKARTKHLAAPPAEQVQPTKRELDVCARPNCRQPRHCDIHDPERGSHMFLEPKVATEDCDTCIGPGELCDEHEEEEDREEAAEQAQGEGALTLEMLDEALRDHINDEYDRSTALAKRVEGHEFEADAHGIRESIDALEGRLRDFVVAEVRRAMSPPSFGLTKEQFKPPVPTHAFVVPTGQTSGYLLCASEGCGKRSVDSVHSISAAPSPPEATGPGHAFHCLWYQQGKHKEGPCDDNCPCWVCGYLRGRHTVPCSNREASMSPALENPTEKKQPPVTGHAFVRDLDGRCDKRRGDYYRCGEKADDPIHAVPPITEGRK